jgi:hypothetical protein
MSQFNYVLTKNSNNDEYKIAKVFESPTYTKIHLDLNEAYENIKIQNKNDFPELFNKTTTDKLEFISPIRKVMCRIDECDFCNKRKTDDDIHQEYTDINSNLGYFYCDDCKDFLIEGLKNTGVRPIWYIRERFEKEHCRRCFVWIERTRRNHEGIRIDEGPFTFEKWEIIGWYAHMMIDKCDNIEKPHIVCEGKGYSKSVSIEQILRLNPKDDPDYNPNDDPIYKL